MTVRKIEIQEIINGIDERVYRFTDGKECKVRTYAYFGNTSESKPFGEVYPPESAELKAWSRSKQEKALRTAYHK